MLLCITIYEDVTAGSDEDGTSDPAAASTCFVLVHVHVVDGESAAPPKYYGSWSNDEPPSPSSCPSSREVQALDHDGADSADAEEASTVLPVKDRAPWVQRTNCDVFADGRKFGLCPLVYVPSAKISLPSGARINATVVHGCPGARKMLPMRGRERGDGRPRVGLETPSPRTKRYSRARRRRRRSSRRRRGNACCWSRCRSSAVVCHRDVLVVAVQILVVEPIQQVPRRQSRRWRGARATDCRARRRRRLAARGEDMVRAGVGRGTRR